MHITAINTIKLQQLKNIANQATLAVFDIFKLMAVINEHQNINEPIIDPLTANNIKIKTDMLTQMLIQTGHIIHTSQPSPEPPTNKDIVTDSPSEPVNVKDFNIVPLFKK